MRSTIAVVALLALVASSAMSQSVLSGGLDLDFDLGFNVSLDTSSLLQFSMRDTLVTDMSSSVLTGVTFTSYSVQLSGFSITADTLFGSVYTKASGPVVWMAYMDTFSAGISGLTADYNVSNDATHFLVSAYTKLVEKKADGTVEKELSLADHATGASGTFSWSKAALKTDGEVKYLVLNGTDSAMPGFYISMAFVVSSKVGVLGVANTVVQPRAVESIVHIVGWPYANAGNTLSLEVVAGTGAADIAGQELVSTLAAANNAKMYFTSAAWAIVDGANKTVSASAWTDASLTNLLPNLSELQTQLTDMFSTPTIKAQLIKFPAGAADIVFDPTVGQGSPVKAGIVALPPSSAVAQVASALAVLFAVVLSVLFM